MKIFTKRNAIMAGVAYLGVLALAVYKSGAGFTMSNVVGYATSPITMGKTAFGGPQGPLPVGVEDASNPLNAGGTVASTDPAYA